MKFPSLFGLENNPDEIKDESKDESKADEAKTSVANSDLEDTEKEGVSNGTKLKVVAALFVIAFAIIVAFWVQEPSDNLRVDALSGTQETSATGETAVTTESLVTTSATDATLMTTQEVSIVDFSFDPANLQVAKGTKVIWTNKDSVPHTVTSDTVTGDTFTSGKLNAGDTFEHVFTEDGTFSYSCSFHPQMKGSVLAGVATGTTLEVFPEQLLPSAPESDLIEPVVTLMPELISVTNTNVHQVTSATSETSMTQETMETHAAAEEKDRQITKSGPEHFIYLGIFLAILYFNRRKLAGTWR